MHKYLLAGIAVVAALCVVTYIHFWVSLVVVVNRTDKPISKIKIELAGKAVWDGSVAAGDSKHLLTIIENDGDAIASYEIDSRKIVINCGYIMGGPMATTIKFSLNADQGGCGA